MADSQFIWMDGKLTRYEDATTHILSHTLHYGTGAFEGIRAYRMHDGKTAVFRGREHFKRFIKSVKALGATLPYSVEDLFNAAAETIRKNQFDECYIRPIAYLGDSIRGLKLPVEPIAKVTIATWPWGKYMGDEGQNKGVVVGISSYRRPLIGASLPEAKLTGAYVTSVLARREATLNRFDEAVLLDAQGFVAEGSGENIFVVNEGELITPPRGSILPGITRDSVIALARHAGITVTERHLTRNELYISDEVFFTGTAAEITPIREIDHLKIGTSCPGPTTSRLMELFFQAVRGKSTAFESWLDRI